MATRGDRSRRVFALGLAAALSCVAALAGDDVVASAQSGPLVMYDQDTFVIGADGKVRAVFRGKDPDGIAGDVLAALSKK